MTTSRSATSSTSSSLWLISTTGRPEAAMRLMIPNRRPVSSGERTEVGSSRIRTRAPTASVRRSSSCWRSARRHLPDPRREVDLEADLGHQRADPVVGAGRLEQTAAMQPERDVLETGQRLDQPELLVDHPDAGGDGGARRAQRQRLPLDQNAAALRQVQAGQHVHRRGLAGAVLAEQTDDQAGGDVEADVVVGQAAARSAWSRPPGGPEAVCRSRARACCRPPAALAVPRRGAQGILPTTPSTSQPMPLMSAMLKVLPAATTSLP